MVALPADIFQAVLRRCTGAGRVRTTLARIAFVLALIGMAVTETGRIPRRHDDRYGSWLLPDGQSRGCQQPNGCQDRTDRSHFTPSFHVSNLTTHHL